MAGLNCLWVEVNPLDAYHKPEQYHFNNIAQIYFTVESDKINPMLDITFDGVHILDGDIVSAKPQIQIQLKDENPYRIMNSSNDTSLFQLFMKTPFDNDAKRIYFKSNGQNVMNFYPASSGENRCKIEYNAAFPEDGTYQLLVQAKDLTSNLSGDINYKINFEIINKSTITNILNWPNPFSTATHFVFTLTGSEIPDYFKIQIMTITGKLVREINVDELGPIHVGRNITEYAWNGTDQYGDRLANGVYLYRVITKINQNSIEKNATSADKFFIKDFGKMVLIR
ncbi:MAG: hypothetical protein WC223_10685 [Bacteroidales bacterium]|jgi:hypothetical protein